MQDVCADAAPVGLIFHNDDNTPAEFVARLLREVFGWSVRGANALTSAIDKNGRAGCGPYPPTVAAALVEEAQRRIRTAGHSLRITTETADANASEEEAFKYAYEALAWHFVGMQPDDIATSVRQFPAHMRADVQLAVDKLFAGFDGFFGIHEEFRNDLEFASLIGDGRYAPTLVPPQYHAIDIGEAAPVKCLRNGLWLCREGELRYAVVLSRHLDDNKQAVLQIEIAGPDSPAAEDFVRRCFDELEAAVHAARSYRGKILSFDLDENYRGRATGIMVHQLPSVAREQVILPERTLKLLDRNVLHFIGSRESLRRLGQSTRKGILLYGPPGTGKTHTIRYLATSLPGHTTLIITAAEVAILGAYMTLARLLQPSIVVIEDVDLIARDREEMRGPCEESLLNKLLNEMDGLKEDADILFVLTTNRPEELEHALAGRPGRIDQAIEVPLPDAAGREKLVRLYGKGLPLDHAVAEEATRRTEGVSAAFIKELMRRIAQSAIARDGGQTVVTADIDEALDDMLFAGGRLNVKLLGGAQEMVA
jgi:ATP-dependent 26S proteasome regulatory subunit/ATP-dependent Clp protease adapter protein ClpS